MPSLEIKRLEIKRLVAFTVVIFINQPIQGGELMATLTETRNEESRAEKLEKLGMTAAAKSFREKALMGRKMMIAYEHFRFVKLEKIAEFTAKLQKESKYLKTLSFTPLELYGEIPPNHVLESLESAQGKKCFDSFEVAHVVDVKDLILFGVIQGCPDKFFIDQWDDDVKIEDILKENEG